MSERKGFGKGIQPGYLVHGASSHHFLCPCLDPSASDISGFPTTVFKGIEATAGDFFFLRCLEVRICYALALEIHTLLHRGGSRAPEL